MSTATVVLILAAAATSGVIPTAEVEKQNTVFQNLWETEFRWEFDKLPLNGGVESARVPYSGYIYPDTEGGTVHSLQNMIGPLTEAARSPLITKGGTPLRLRSQWTDSSENYSRSKKLRIGTATVMAGLLPQFAMLSPFKASHEMV